jgi:hypothetical protein
MSARRSSKESAGPAVPCVSAGSEHRSPVDTYGQKTAG